MMSARDLARAARRVIDLAHARLRAGDAILVFGEGRRSRTASMRPLLTGVARYVDAPGSGSFPWASRARRRCSRLTMTRCTRCVSR
jgi:hypothetical protein